ncbi:MAG: response regulator [Nitrospinae bacterium]|nr:response regulator [Nitrospinota bacterium]
MTNIPPLLFGLALFFSAALNAEALEAFTPSETMDGAFIGKYVEHFADPTKQLTLADVRSEAHRSQFVPVNHDTLDFGMSDAAHWLHLTVNNPNGREMKWIMQAEHPPLSHIEVYEISHTGQIRFHEGGNRIPFNRRDIAYRKNAFSMSTIPGTSEIYIKVWGKLRIVANCSLTAWGTNHFLAKNNIETLLLGLYFGALLVMCLYNLFIYFSVRDTVYLIYVTYILLAGLTYFGLNGLAFQYLWPSSPFLGNHSSMLFGIFSFGLAVSFSRSFLDTKVFTPSLDKILMAIVLFCAFDGILSLFEGKSFTFAVTIGYLSTLIFPPLLLYAGIRSLKAGNRQARFYVAAWTMYLTGVLLYFLKDFGVLPYSFITAYSMQIGTLADVILLSLALADRIKILREEKEAAEARTIDILVKSKGELETQVALKTEEHRKAREEAENATRLKDKFVSLVTHDLKSPLSSLTLGLETLHNGDALSPGDRSFVGKMATHSRELLNLTERLLDLSRLQAGRIIPQKRFINCRGFANAQIGLYKTMAAQKEIAIVNDLPDTMKVYADPDLFGECVKNVLSNAVKFCDKGDTITFFNPSDMPSTIAVKDNGPGIAPEKMPSLFAAEMKMRSLGTAGEKGTGIGLPHTKELMEAHGGTITVESEPGKGSTFFLAFPPSFNVTVLVVDDQEVVRAAIKEHCAGIFPGILEAGNGAEALEIIRNVVPHLIITDINMPVMDGLKFIQQVRNGGLARRVPIIAMTSDESWPTPNGMDIRSYCLHIGADDFVNKPVAANDLAPRVNRLLQGAR